MAYWWSSFLTFLRAQLKIYLRISFEFSFITLIYPYGLCLSLWMFFIFIGILRSNQFLRNMQLWFGYSFVIGSVWRKSAIITMGVSHLWEGGRGGVTFLLLSLNFFQLFFQLEMCYTSLPASSSYETVFLFAQFYSFGTWTDLCTWRVEKIVATQLGQHVRLLLTSVWHRTPVFKNSLCCL